MHIVMKKMITILSSVLILSSCADNKEKLSSELEIKMNSIAEEYVKLVLEMGVYKSDYVDAYYGPEEWKPDNTNNKIDSSVISSLNSKADNLLNDLDGLKNFMATDLEKMRFRFLYKQLLSVKGMIFIISGGSFPFDIETKRIYDIEVPHQDKEHFKIILGELDKLIPGEGKLSERLNKFREQFYIPEDKLDTVFSAALFECRRRTLQHIELPQNENFSVQYVKDKPWGAYNWYKGKSFSVIQVNTDLPVKIDQAIGLAAHEGYPGHHVFIALMEKKFVEENGWMEFSVYPLYSPLSLIAEGTANYGIKVAFPGDERMKFERDVLFPLAGLDPGNVELYYRILELMEDLAYASNEVARNYIDGSWNKNEAVKYMEDYQLFTKERAKQRLSFFEQYRSYIINYNIGEDLVKNYVERNGGTSDNPARRWEVFKELLLNPQTPSGLK
jgi:hypothetical protein